MSFLPHPETAWVQGYGNRYTHLPQRREDLAASFVPTGTNPYDYLGEIIIGAYSNLPSQSTSTVLSRDFFILPDLFPFMIPAQDIQRHRAQSPQMVRALWGWILTL